MKKFMPIVCIVALSGLLQAHGSEKTAVPLTCEWVSYSRHYETFIIYLDKHEVEWVSGNSKKPPIIIPLEIKTDGVIAFGGMKKNVEISGNKTADVYMRFVIDRVVGKMRTYVSKDQDNWLELGADYQRLCEVGKLF